MASQETDLERVRDWLDKLYVYLNDADGKRRRQIDAHFESYSADGGGHPLDAPRALRRELTDRVAPVAGDDIRPLLKKTSSALASLCGLFSVDSMLISPPEAHRGADECVNELRRLYRELNDALAEREAESAGNGDEDRGTERFGQLRPGRPSARSISLEVFEERCGAGEVKMTIGDEARAIAGEVTDRIQAKRLDLYAPTPRTVEDHIRDAFNAHRESTRTK